MNGSEKSSIFQLLTRARFSTLEAIPNCGEFLSQLASGLSYSDFTMSSVSTRKSQTFLTVPLTLLAVFALTGLGSACTRKDSKSKPAAANDVPHRLAVLAGGSGEEEEENFLIEDLRNFRTSLAARGWDVRAVAGARDGLIGSSKKATGANILATVRDTLARAASGDQALIVIHSHGLEQEPAWGQRTHSIASEDIDPSGAQPGFDLDTLEPELVRARDRGVRVALVDLSCYSGRTQVMAGPACTLTLAAPAYVSFCSSREEERHFTASFFGALKGSRNTSIDLESHFLESRRRDRDSVNLPQLSSRSTPGATLWSELLAGLDPLDLTGDIAGARAAVQMPSFKPLRDLVRREVATMGLTAPLRAKALEISSRMIARRERIEHALPQLAAQFDRKSLTVNIPGRAPLPISPGNLSDLLGRLDRTEHPLDGLSHPGRALLTALEPLRPEIEGSLSLPLKQFRELDAHIREEAASLEEDAGFLLNLEREIYELKSSRTADGCSSFHL